MIKCRPDPHHMSWLVGAGKAPFVAVTYVLNIFVVIFKYGKINKRQYKNVFLKVKLVRGC
jgi:hypothetical protein